MKRIVLAFSIMVLAACAANRPIPGEAPPAALPAAAPEKERSTFSNRDNPNGGSAPSFSPDGARIAFLSSTLHTPADLWVMNADGSGARRLTTRGVQDYRWSADGRSLVFSSRRKGYVEILTIGADGGNEQRVPGLPPNASIPVYSPDGTLFAFTALDANDVSNLWIGTADRKRIEPVTVKINVRSFFWSPDSLKICYEAGKTYGVGVWEIDLKKMESRTLVNKYVGTPVFSSRAGLIAYPYPVASGEYVVQTVKPDGSDVRDHKAPRLEGRFLAWDANGQGVYYPARDLAPVSSEAQAKAAGAGKPAGPHDTSQKEKEFERVGTTSLWHFDLASGVERRVSPASLQVADFSFSADGKKALVTGVLEKSRAPEIFSLDLASGELTLLVGGRASAWLPVPTRDGSKIAFFTNEEGLDTLKVAAATGEELAAYPGFVVGGDTRLFWLSESEALMVFSANGLVTFTDKGTVDFPERRTIRAYLGADVSIQEDKVLISGIPQFGESAGLYLLRVADGKFKLTDLRFAPPQEKESERYLQPKWSFDGTKLAFSDAVDIWTMKDSGLERTRITGYARQNREGKARPAYASYPVWSVKGDLLCYTLTVYEEKAVVRQLRVIKADGTEMKLLYSEEVDSHFQNFLPELTNQPFFDGTDERVIFTAAPDGVPNLYAAGIKDGAVRLLAEGAISPALMAEEGTIVYTSIAGNTESLWVMNSDGSGKRPFVVKAKPAPAVQPAPSATGSAGTPSPSGGDKGPAAAGSKALPVDKGAAAAAGGKTEKPAAEKKSAAKKKKRKKAAHKKARTGEETDGTKAPAH